MRRAKIISVQITEGSGGLLHATSPQMRELFVSGRSIDAVKSAVPGVIEAIFEAHGESVRVVEADDDIALPMPWVILRQERHTTHC